MSAPATIREHITALLLPVLPNSWAVDLPPNPAWPAIVFDIDSQPEPGYCAAAGYVQHTVNVVAMARTAEQLDALLPQVVAAFEGSAHLMYEDASGDADYEPEPAVYARFVTFVMRTRR